MPKTKTKRHREIIHWISPADELPDDGIDVLIQSNSASCPVWPGYYDSEDKCFRWCAGREIEAIAWAHMPGGINA